MKVFLLGLVLLGMTACTVIAPTERGVRFNFGKVQDEPLLSGTHFWFPYFAGSTKLDVNVHIMELTTSSGTKDQQEITTTAVVNIQINPERVVDVVKTYGDEDAVLAQVKPQIHEAINANISKFNAEEILTKRDQLKLAIDTVIKERAAKYDIIVHDVSIKDLQYSKEYAKAIEEKQVAEQQAKRAEYVAQKATQDAKGAIEKAKGEAESSLVNARAQAEGQKLLKMSITKDVLALEYLKKWNGVLPTVMSGSGGGLIFNLDMKSKTQE